MKEDNQTILDVFKKNRENGMKMLFKRYYSSLVVYAQGKIKDRGTAEDLVQNFYLRLWENDYLKYTNPTTLESYLYSSIRNACYTYGHQKDILRDSIDYEGIDVAIETAETINQKMVEQVEIVIQKLPKQTQEVVRCILMRNMKYQETANELNISLNTVKTLLKNGMRFLREELRENQEMLLLFMLWQNTNALPDSLQNNLLAN